MNKPLRGSPSLHQLIHDAPIPAILAFFKTSAPASIGDLDPPDGQSDPATRTLLSARVREIDAVLSHRLDDQASRILKLGTGRGAQSLSSIAASGLTSAELQELDAQSDPLGRSLWCFVNAPRTFADSESFQNANHFRNFDKIYSSFGVASSKPDALVWSDTLARALNANLVETLKLSRDCGISHLVVQDELSDDEIAHLVIIRHPGDPSSVPEHRDGGLTEPYYYLPSNEVILVYYPRQGHVEICAESPAIRQDVAGCFAESVLGQDLSREPLSFKRYELGRFQRSLELEQFEPEGFRVRDAAVVEVEVRPGNANRRVALKVLPDDNITTAADALLGHGNVFRRGALVVRVVIAVRFFTESSKRQKTLNITLCYPNRSNLRSEKISEHRRLGYLLLEHWGVLHALKPLTDPDARALLPMLLDLYDLGSESVSEEEILRNGFDPDRLAERGFIRARGLREAMLIDEDDGGPDVVASRPGIGPQVEFEDVTGRTVTLPRALSMTYSVDRAWIRDVIFKQLGLTLGTKGRQTDDECLVALGQIDLAGESVPCFLARGLGDDRIRNRLDRYFRDPRWKCTGLIFNAGPCGPRYLGAQIVLPLRDFLQEVSEGDLVDLNLLLAAFQEASRWMNGTAEVRLVENTSGGATLYLPNKPPFDVAGANQVKVLRKLVEAHHAGSPVVKTKVLLEETSCANVRHVFRNREVIFDTYICKVGDRGGWKLNV